MRKIHLCLCLVAGLLLLAGQISAAVTWFEGVKIPGYKYVNIVAPNEPKGKDRVILPEANSTIWARFYEIGPTGLFSVAETALKNMM